MPRCGVPRGGRETCKPLSCRQFTSSAYRRPSPTSRAGWHAATWCLGTTAELTLLIFGLSIMCSTYTTGTVPLLKQPTPSWSYRDNIGNSVAALGPLGIQSAVGKCTALPQCESPSPCRCSAAALLPASARVCSETSPEDTFGSLWEFFACGV